MVSVGGDKWHPGVVGQMKDVYLRVGAGAFRDSDYGSFRELKD